MKYSFVEDEYSTWIKLQEPPYENIMYSYGGVELIEHEDHAELKFEYTLKDTSLLEQYKDDPDFKKLIGDILVTLVELQLENNNLIYKGGV